MNLSNGTLLGGRYEIVEKIGVGGMATVYRANDTKLERSVTVKVLKEEFTGDEDFRTRFKTEARAAAKLSHPNIVNVYDVGEENGIYYIVMEYVHGDTLKQVIVNSAPFDNLTTLSIAVQMASALEHAHKHGVVHRDIKPQNILIGVDGTIKITDFGIAHAAADSTVTTTNNALGSVYYFSPEQARGGYVDEKSDIYSLGITMYEMLTGRVPYDGETSVSIALKHLNSTLPNMRNYNPQVSDILQNIVRKATQKKKDDRYASCSQLLSDLRQALLEERSEMKQKAEPEEDVTIYEPRKDTSLEEASADASTIGVMMAAEKGVNQEEAQDGIQVELMGKRKEYDLPEEGVSFDRYSKQLKISKENDNYETDQWDEERKRAVHKKQKPKQKPRPKRERGKRQQMDPEEEAYYKSQEKKVTIAAVITALVIIGIITIAGAKVLNGEGIFSFGSSAQADTMPNYLGMDYEKAVTEAQKQGITLNKADEQYSAEFEEGQIMDQSVEAGTTITEGTSVDVTVSLGLKSFPMPDVEYDEEDVAVEKIKSAGGAEPEKEYVFDDVVPQGVVITQDPPAQTQADSSTKITLTISKGPETPTVTVINFKGMTMGEAQSKVTEIGLQVGTITVDNNATGEKDEIISQSLEPDQEVERDTKIDFVVVGEQAVEQEEPEASEETTKPEDTTQETTETTTPSTSGSQTFNIDVPTSYVDANAINVKILRIDSASSSVDVAYNETRALSDFPFSVTVSGSGQMEVQLYIDNVYQWSQMVDFSGGAQ